MKKLLLILLIIGGAVYSNYDKLESLYYEIVNGNNPVPEVYGIYTMESQCTSGILGLRFTSPGRAIILYDGKPLGDGKPVSYVITGRNLKLTHKCGVWNMQIRDNALYHKEDKRLYLKDG